LLGEIAQLSQTKCKLRNRITLTIEIRILQDYLLEILININIID